MKQSRVFASTVSATPPGNAIPSEVVVQRVEMKQSSRRDTLLHLAWLYKIATNDAYHTPQK